MVLLRSASAAFGSAPQRGHVMLEHRVPREGRSQAQSSYCSAQRSSLCTGTEPLSGNADVEKPVSGKTDKHYGKSPPVWESSAISFVEECWGPQAVRDWF